MTANIYPDVWPGRLYRSAEAASIGILLLRGLCIPLSGLRVYLKIANAPGQRVFSRCAASFFLEIRQYSCEKNVLLTMKIPRYRSHHQLEKYTPNEKTVSFGHGFHTIF